MNGKNSILIIIKYYFASCINLFCKINMYKRLDDTN